MSHDSGSPLSCQAATLSKRSLKRENETVVNQSSLAYPDGFASVPTLDWLAFTLHVVPPEKRKLPDDDTRDGRIVRLLETGELEYAQSLLALKSAVMAELGGGAVLPYGLHRYSSSASVLGTGRVCWHEGRPEMGVHVVLPSSALQNWAVVSRTSVLDFLYKIASRGAKFSRVDIAIDTDAVSMDTVVDAYESGQIVTKLQNEQLIDGRKRGVSTGKTLNIGSRSGRRYIRIYDKGGEQSAKGEQVDGVWTRCEVEFKQEHAQTAVDHLLSGADARELILSSIDFRELDNSEVKRRTPCEWWRSWVEVAETVSFPVRKAAAAVADTMAWVVKQVSPALAWLSSYMGNTYWLDRVIEDAVTRVPAYKWDLLPLPIGSLSATAGVGGAL